MKKIFVITDNTYIFERFRALLERYENLTVNYFCTPSSKELFNKEITNGLIETIQVKENISYFSSNFDLGFSCHSKQIFPAEVVNSCLCINIHPGLNPYNRGWYPQVFSIINGLPAGATIHVMDEEIDHGEIIAQEEIEIESYDTSLDVYNKVLKKEVELLELNLESIIDLKFETAAPASEGNYNSISDYRKLCHINLDETVTMGEAINFLKAMTHEPYRNAFFIDSKGSKVYVKIHLEASPFD